MSRDVPGCPEDTADTIERWYKARWWPALDVRRVYPLVNIQKLWKITFFNGKIHYKSPCSIAMLNYQRVIPNWLETHHMPTFTNPGGFQRFQLVFISRIIEPRCWNYQHLPHKWPGFVGKYTSTMASGAHGGFLKSPKDPKGSTLLCWSDEDLGYSILLENSHGYPAW